MNKSYEEYYKKLVKQFINAKGIKKVEYESKEFVNDFLEWLMDQKLASQKYVSILEYIEAFPLYDKTTVEIGKGIFDSIGKDLGIKVITPYYEKMNNSVIGADLKIIRSIPTVMKSYNDDILLMPLNPRRFRNFITQNPYNIEDLENWEILHNEGYYNIVVGIYGQNSDKDRSIKVKKLKQFKEKLESGYKEEQAIIYNDYYYLIYSDNPIKRLTKKL